VILIGVLVVAVTITVIAMAMTGEPAPRAGLPVTTAPEEAIAPPAPPAPAAFVGIPLAGKRVILSIDGGSSMSDSFDFLRRGVLRSAERLAAGKELRVVLWNDSGVSALPPASAGHTGPLKEALEAAVPQGASDPEQSMKATLALAESGDQVLFVTAKFNLPEGLSAAVLKEAQPNVRIDGVKLVSHDAPSPLEAMARATGGQYVFLAPSDLDQATR
jgi:hypothetical protein